MERLGGEREVMIGNNLFLWGFHDSYSLPALKSSDAQFISIVGSKPNHSLHLTALPLHPLNFLFTGPVRWDTHWGVKNAGERRAVWSCVGRVRMVMMMMMDFVLLSSTLPYLHYCKGRQVDVDFVLFIYLVLILILLALFLSFLFFFLLFFFLSKGDPWIFGWKDSFIVLTCSTRGGGVIYIWRRIIHGWMDFFPGPGRDENCDRIPFAFPSFSALLCSPFRSLSQSSQENRSSLVATGSS